MYTRWLVVDAEETAKRQLRAYVCVTAAEIRTFGTSEPLEAVIQTKNAGQTPAYEMTARLGIAAMSDANNLPPPKESPGATYVGPNTDHYFTVPTNNVLKPEQQQMVERGDVAIYVYGDLHYRDAFKVERYVHFRLRTRNNGNTLLERNGAVVKLSPDEKGNDAN